MKLAKFVLRSSILSFIFPLVFALLFRFPVIKLGFVGPLGEHNFFQGTFAEQLLVIRMIYVTWIGFGIMGYFYAVLVLGIIGYFLSTRFTGNQRAQRWLLILPGIFPVFVLSIFDLL